LLTHETRTVHQFKAADMSSDTDGHAAVCKVRSSLLLGHLDTIQWPSSQNYELGRRWENKQPCPSVRPSVTK